MAKDETRRLTNADLTPAQLKMRAKIKKNVSQFCVDLGRHITKVRIRKGKSQDRVSMEAGLSRAALSRIEAGKVDPQISTLQRISEVLKVPLSELTSVKKAGGWFPE
jgi:DNA-binding XRE family transcriptional regulator